jgi:beta-glucanase (GH16 family)
LAVGVVVGGAACVAAAQTAAPALPGWTLVFSDEFEGTALDGAKWRAENAALVKNNEQQYYAPSNVTVADGLMTILAERRAMGGRPYTSGLIETRNRFSQAFGRFEVRAKLPSTRGMWPAIWMLPQAGIWPPEIDVMELLGHQPTTVYMSHHWGPPTAVGTQTTAFTGPDFSAGFHTFAVEWFPERMDFFVDGVLRARHTQNVPRNPMYLIINTAVGGNWPGLPDETTVFPQRMEVEYARVYRRNLANESFDDLGPAGNQPLFAWATFGNAFVDGAGARTGSRLGKMFGNFTGGFNVTGMTQEAAVTPGEVWRASAWWLNKSNDRMQGSNSAVARLEWVTEAGVVVSAVEAVALTAASPLNTFVPVSVEGVVPVGAARARVGLVFRQPGMSPGAAFVDDVVLERVVCAADFNADGRVDPDDLADYIGCFFAVPACAGADFDSSGQTNPDDLADFISAFFGPCA